MTNEFQFDELPALPFDAFGPELDNLITSAGNLLERQWPEKWRDTPEAGSALRSFIMISQNTYRAIRFLTADTDLPGRRLEFGLTVGPMVRSILDSLCSVVFILEDVPDRTEWFMRAGWREVLEEHQRYSDRYSDKPEWEQWIDGFGEFVQRMQEAWGIPEELAANPKQIRYWPIPSQMLRDEETSAERIEYLQLLYDGFYRELSAESHLSWPGMARRSHFLIDHNPDVLRKVKSDAVGLSATFMLAMVSELEMEIRWDISDRCRYVWRVMGGFLDFAQEIFDFRYAEEL